MYLLSCEGKVNSQNILKFRQFIGYLHSLIREQLYNNYHMIHYCEQVEDQKGQAEIEESIQYLLKLIMSIKGSEISSYGPDSFSKQNYSFSEFCEDPPIQDFAQYMPNFETFGECTSSELYQQINSKMVEEGSEFFEQPSTSEYVTSEISHLNQSKPKTQRIREKNQNICKKYNTIACKILKTYGCDKQIKIIKKLIHRIDFFIITMMIAEVKGKGSKFNKDYRKNATIMMNGFQQENLEDKNNYKVEKGHKTLKSLDAFEKLNFEQSILQLFDDDKTKNKEPKDRSLKMLKELKTKITKNSSSIKPILAQFMRDYEQEKKIKR